MLASFLIFSINRPFGPFSKLRHVIPFPLLFLSTFVSLFPFSLSCLSHVNEL